MQEGKKTEAIKVGEIAAAGTYHLSNLGISIQKGLLAMPTIFNLFLC